MINQINCQSKFTPKGKAILSLIIGIISGIPIILLEIVLDIFHWIPPMISIPIFPILPLISIFGLILGIQGLKSTKRNLAIAGIVLNLIGLLIPLYYFLFY